MVAVGLRTEVTARTTGDGKGIVTLEVPQLEARSDSSPSDSQREPVRWAELAAMGAEVSSRWQLYNRSEVPISAILGETLLPQAILGVVAHWLGELPSVSLRLRVASELPIGAGLGSSASVAAAMVAATLDAIDVTVPAAEVEALILECERLQHGHPSGIDAAAVLRGGALVIRRETPAQADQPLELEVEVLDVDEAAFRGFRLFDTGRPPESTGEVVTAVRELRSRDVEAFDDELRRAEDAALAMLDGLRRAESSDGGAVIATAMRVFQRWLEGIGVVPAEIATLIAKLEARGLAAKISGAGSLVGPGAGLALVYDAGRSPRSASGSRWWHESWTEIEAPLGAPGLCRHPADIAEA